MNALPFFYHKDLDALEDGLPSDTSKHIVQVLRMEEGEQLILTDGNGTSAFAHIRRIQGKKVYPEITRRVRQEERKPFLHLAVALTKNTSRNEWMLEKATELGIKSFTPLITQRTEREKIRADRWQNILVSAMLQSRQSFLPMLREPESPDKLIAAFGETEQKLIAYCGNEAQRQSLKQAMQPHKETLILIGPEGDFTPEEVALCRAQGFGIISLGSTRLRTETAAMAVCSFFNLINDENP